MSESVRRPGVAASFKLAVCFCEQARQFDTGTRGWGDAKLLAGLSLVPAILMGHRLGRKEALKLAREHCRLVQRCAGHPEQVQLAEQWLGALAMLEAATGRTTHPGRVWRNCRERTEQGTMFQTARDAVGATR